MHVVVIILTRSMQLFTPFRKQDVAEFLLVSAEVKTNIAQLFRHLIKDKV